MGNVEVWTKTQMPWRKREVTSLSSRPPQDTGRTRMRQYNLAGRLSWAGQGLGSRSPRRHGLPSARIYKRERKLSW